MPDFQKPSRLSSGEVTVLGEDLVGPMAPIRIRQPSDTYPVTPASLIAVQAISQNPQFFHGAGVDWGCGTGGLAIVAAKMSGVRHVMGLDIEPANVRASRDNADRNGVGDATTFLVADSFRAANPLEQPRVDAMKGAVDFVFANPPASDGDDGFSFRRRVVADVRGFLKPGGNLFLQISIQYGMRRVTSLCDGDGGIEHAGVVATTDWTAFDLDRADLGQNMDDYVAVEEQGGVPYEFGDPSSNGESRITARQARALRDEKGLDPLSKWQIHRFTVTRPSPRQPSGR